MKALKVFQKRQPKLTLPPTGRRLWKLLFYMSQPKLTLTPTGTRSSEGVLYEPVQANPYTSRYKAMEALKVF
jgi:hypothetical protein